MTHADTVYIHHPELEAEAKVAAETVPGWEGKGWVAGRLPGAAEAEQAAIAAEIDQLHGSPLEPVAEADTDVVTGPEVASGDPESVPTGGTEHTPQDDEEDSQ